MIFHKSIKHFEPSKPGIIKKGLYPFEASYTAILRPETINFGYPKILSLILKIALLQSQPSIYLPNDFCTANVTAKYPGMCN